MDKKNPALGGVKQITENPDLAEVAFNDAGKDKQSQQETARQDICCVVVLLHGLTMPSSETDKIKKGVEEKFGKVVEVIQPTCRKGVISARLSIDKQAEMVVEEVESELCKKYLKYSKKALKDLPWMIIGHSQGAEVAMNIGYYYSDQLNIAGIISIGGPLTGTDVLENTRSDVNEFYEKAEKGLEVIGVSDSRWSQKRAKAAATVLNNFLLKPGADCLLKGVSDMRTGSSCSQKIKEFIRDNKNHKSNAHHIPILLIAVYIRDWNKCFPLEEEQGKDVEEFFKVYTKFTTRQENGAHDLLISVKRQLCRTNSFGNLAASKNDPVYPLNVSTYILEDKLHCTNLMSITSFVSVANGELSVNAEETIEVITDFITKNLYTLRP
ncbi:hypothetical protein [Cardinium endosymbiont of Nabis limbatus]|uniref:hypothetical protein n=1 Tax=Cardinium endosymbiont of Nabis limbatus TaxID=3066217 RepID=UPI003AF3E370